MGVQAVVGADRPFGEGQVAVRDDQFGVDFQAPTQPHAGPAGPERAVEAESPRLHVGRHEVRVVRIVILLGKAVGPAVVVDIDDEQEVLGRAQAGLDRLADPFGRFGVVDDAVDDDLDRMLLVLVQVGELVQIVNDAVDPGPAVTLAAVDVRDMGVLAFLGFDDRRQDQVAVAFRQSQDALGYLFERHRPDRLAGRIVGRAGPGVEQPEIVVYLRDRRHRAARIARSRLLVDGNDRAEAVDPLDGRLLFHAQKLPGVGAERFQVAALAFGEDGVEGQRRLAGSRHPGDDDQFAARDVDADVLQVVFLGALYANMGGNAHNLPIITGNGLCFKTPGQP